MVTSSALLVPGIFGTRYFPATGRLKVRLWVCGLAARGECQRYSSAGDRARRSGADEVNSTWPSLGGLELVTRGQAWTADVIQRISTLVPLMIVTLLGNVVIIVVLTCSRRHNISSRVNIFIINLAIGDLTVLTCTMTTEVSFIVSTCLKPFALLFYQSLSVALKLLPTGILEY